MYELLTYLMRGGSYGHYWFKQSRETLWWDTSEIPDQTEFQNEDAYFGVHPSKIRKGSYKGTTFEDIEAVNCLFADIDDKDFDGTAVEHIKSLDPSPSAIVSSGSGYHLYWLLDKPLILDSPLKREIARTLQERWAPYVGGDSAVHDLARILRLPGTRNHKTDPPKPVSLAYLNLNRTYTFEQLSEFLPAEDEHRADDDDQEIPVPKAPNNLSLQDLVDRAKQSKRGSAFTSLWRGQTSEKYASESEGDLALCCLLAFWTGGDYEKMDALFRMSRRYREKWEREDYRHSTLTQALGQVTNYYRDPGDLYLAGAHDEGNAQCVRSKYRNKFLYDKSIGWREYSGTHWGGELAEPHLEGKIIEVLKARQAAAWAHSADDRSKSVARAAMPSSRNIENTHRILKDMLAVAGSEFNISPDDLNVKNGVINLRTGKLRPHHFTQRFTYCLPTAYNPKADQSVWVDWLLGAVNGNQEVVDYLKSAVGYSLTGHTREEIVFYLHGPTRSGKGIFTETLLNLLGYAPLGTEVGIKMFMSDSGQDAQGFAMAGLRSTRFLATSETKSKSWMDGSKLKSMTGGNLIRCAHKGKPFFTYMPKFKIWMTSNFPPRLDVDDTAAWGRLRIIEFPISHLDDANTRLKGKMRQPDVLAGVLAWIVEGAIKWYTGVRTGLKTPESVVSATLKFRERDDQVGAWARDRLVNTGNNDDRLSYGDAYVDYQIFCAENGEKDRPRKHWKSSLATKGYDMKKIYAIKRGDGTKSTQQGWVGMKLAGGFSITITGGA